MFRQIIVMMVLVLVLVAALPLDAWACPTCKEGIAANDPAQVGMVRGYFWSIIFMMSMPFLILTGIGGYFYYEIRRGRRAIASTTGASDWASAQA